MTATTLCYTSNSEIQSRLNKLLWVDNTKQIDPIVVGF